MWTLSAPGKFENRPETPGAVLIDATSIVIGSELVHSRHPSGLSLLALSNIIDAALFHDRILTLAPSSDPWDRFNTAVRRVPLRVEGLVMSKDERRHALETLQEPETGGLGLVQRDQYGNPFIPKESVDRVAAELASPLDRERKFRPWMKGDIPPDKIVFTAEDFAPEEATPRNLFEWEVLDSFGSFYVGLQWDRAVQFPIRDPEDRSIVEYGYYKPPTGANTAMIAYRAHLYLQLAGKLGIPYRPDGIRADFVDRRIQEYESAVADVVRIALRKVDRVDAKRVEAVNARLRVRKFQTRGPLLLNYVLEQAGRPERIFEVVKDLAVSSKARKVRAFMADLDSTVNSQDGDTDRMERLLDHLDSLQQDLAAEFKCELARVVVRTSLSAGGDLALSWARPSTSIPNVLEELADSNLWEKFLAWVGQRNLLFLKDPGGEGRSLHGLGRAVEKVFGEGVSERELALLSRLRGLVN